MSEVIERLNKRIVWWRSSSKNERLYDQADCDLDEEVADALEAKDKLISNMAGWLESRGVHHYTCLIQTGADHCNCGLQDLISKAKEQE